MLNLKLIALKRWIWVTVIILHFVLCEKIVKMCGVKVQKIQCGPWKTKKAPDMTFTRHHIRKQTSLKEIRVTAFEVLSDGQKVPVYEPVEKSKRIRQRKYNEAIKKFATNLHKLLDNGYRVIRIEGYKLSPQPTEEEKLLRYTHRVLVLKHGDKTVECIVPIENRCSVNYLGHVTRKYVTLSDENGVAVAELNYHGDQEIINVQFDLAYIDFYSLETRQIRQRMSLENKEHFKVEIMLSRGLFTFVWRFHDTCMCWDFNKHALQNDGGDARDALLKEGGIDNNNSTKQDLPVQLTHSTTYVENGASDTLRIENDGGKNDSTKQTPPRFIQFTTDEQLSEAIYVTLENDHIIVVSKDDDFYDSVFESDDASLRMTSYYSCKTGQRFNSKNVIAQIIEQSNLAHVSDTVFLDIPSNPKWMVLEWMLPDITLSSIYIYRQQDDGNLVSDGVINFETDFSEYKNYFGKLNELQSKVVITRAPWRAFIWVSLNHVIIVDLQTYEIVGILHADLSPYKDISNRYVHEFQLSVSRTSHRVVLYVKCNKELVHYCRYNLLPLQTLKPLSMRQVIDTYAPIEIIQNAGIDETLKREIQDAY